MVGHSRPCFPALLGSTFHNPDRPEAAAVEPQQRTPQVSVWERRGRKNTAMGFTGEPVPRPRRSGAITQKKERRSSWHSRRSSSRRR